MSISLEFGRYGAEGLGKLAESKPVKEMSYEILSKLCDVWNKVVKAPKDSWTKKVVKGRSIFTNARGEKAVKGAANNLCMERTLINNADVYDGEIPLIKYVIERPNSITRLYMKPLENGKFTPVRDRYDVQIFKRL